MKIRRVGAELFRADGQTDRQTDRQTDSCSVRTGRQTVTTKLIVGFCNFTQAPNSCPLCKPYVFDF